MRFLSIKALSSFSLMTLVAAAPVSDPFPDGNPFPLANGFPNPSPQAIKDLEVQAHGNLPGAELPPTISGPGLNRVFYLAFHEMTESAFFSEVVFNITNRVPGFEVTDLKLLNSLTRNFITIQAQEEIHVVSAQGILEKYTNKTLQPCRYNFPVNTLEEAVELAALFSSMGSGTLQDVTLTLAQNGDAPFTAVIASVLAQEGEQAGWYRVLQDKVPSEAPFFSPGVGSLTYSWLNTFTIPGSCPNTSSIPIPITPPLNLLTIPTPSTSKLRFSYEKLSAPAAQGALSLVYLNQQNGPIVQNVSVVDTTNGTVTLEALFPFPQFNMLGLTQAVLTNSSGPFESAGAVAAAVVFGPAPFDVE